MVNFSVVCNSIYIAQVLVKILCLKKANKFSFLSNGQYNILVESDFNH